MGDQGRCENSKKKLGAGGGGVRLEGGDSRGGGVRVDVNEEWKFFVKIKIKNWVKGGGGGGGVGLGGSGWM